MQNRYIISDKKKQDGGYAYKSVLINTIYKWKDGTDSDFKGYRILRSGFVLWTCTSHIGQYLLVSRYRTMHILQTEDQRNITG